MPRPKTPKKTKKTNSRIAHLSKEEFYKLRRNSDNVKNMFGNNENVENITHYEGFEPKSTEEASVARIRARLNTPPRSTREPWGKPGFLPSNAPRRKTRRNRK